MILVLKNLFYVFFSTVNFLLMLPNFFVVAKIEKLTVPFILEIGNLVERYIEGEVNQINVRRAILSEFKEMSNIQKRKYNQVINQWYTKHFTLLPRLTVLPPA